MDEVKRILDYLENTEKTLVFTSETAARNALSAFIIRNDGKAVFKDRTMSWDSFYLSLLDTNGKRSVTKTERKIFAYTFLKNGGLTSLSTFASGEYPESILAYSSSIASLLPYFPSPDDSIREHISRDMLRDIELLRTAYSSFLDKKGLYEKNYLVPDYTKIEKGKYVFVFPSTFTSSSVQDILRLGKVEVIDAPDGGETPLIEYPNAISEIRWTLRRIKEDRKKYRDDEIALSSSSIDSYRPYLESEAKKRDIPLVFTSSRPLSSYSEGMFLHQVYSTVTSGWTFKETKKLLLDPRYPYRDRDMNIRIIRLGVEKKMEDGGRECWMRILDGEEREFFRKASESAEGIVKSTRSSLIVKHIQEFRDNFFEDGEWNEEDDRVFGSALDILRETGDEEIPHLYSLFLSLVDETGYVERSDSESGIRVYSYPASAGLITPVHYVIGLDDRTTRMKIDDYPFLVSLTRPEALDITEAVLKTYRATSFCDKLVISGTTDGFDGARLLPPLFLDSTVRNKEEIGDEYSGERDLWIENKSPEEKPSISQADGFKRARKTSLRGHSEEVTADPFTDEKVSISVSKMKEWDMCPYRGYASTRLCLQDKDFEPKLEDPLVIGNILHETVEESIAEAGTIANIDIERMQARFSDKLDESVKKHKITSHYSYEHMKGRFIDKLEYVKSSSKASVYDYLTLEENEKKIENYPLTGEITVNGRVDTILVNDENGDAYIIDWKTTGSSDYSPDLGEISLQVILYAVLLEDDDTLSVKGGAFYSFSDCNYKIIWPSEEYWYTNCNRKGKEGFDVTLLKTEIEERLAKIRSALESGNFTPTVTEHSCTNCPYPRLCRAKFVASMEENND